MYYSEENMDKKTILADLFEEEDLYGIAVLILLMVQVMA